MAASRRSTGSRTIVITGAGTGIGRALALAYADPSARLLLIGRRLPELEQTAAAARQCGADVEIGQADVTDAAALDRLARRCHERFGPISVLVANAGISHGTLSSEPADRVMFARIVATNLVGVEYTVSAFLPYLATGARIAGIASIAGLRGLPGASAYCASKAGLIAYLESLRLELRPRAIRVCCIAPGYIATPMTAENTYPMPWLMPVERAARRMRRAIDRGRPWLVVPWQMPWVGRLLRILPIPIFDFVFARAPTKARTVAQKSPDPKSFPHAGRHEVEGDS
ncbi:MAG: SDR family oxidoreductase [Acidithiobacillus caldus]|nr:SDR family oxidoreductase [Acidithiobacillus caldus]